jgi:MarR family transcriptional regulator for hemolysin
VNAGCLDQAAQRLAGPVCRRLIQGRFAGGRDGWRRPDRASPYGRAVAGLTNYQLIAIEAHAACLPVCAAKPADPLRHFGFLLRDVSRLHARNFERQSQELGLSLTQCQVLAYLQRHQGVSQARLAELLDMDPMTLGRLLERMAADGLVDRQADPQDRRAHRVMLLARALPLLDQIWQLADRARAQSLAGLSAAERSALMGLLQRVHGNLDALMPGAADTAALAPHRSTSC